ncbi:MAG: hypothetical protein HY774_00505 [Acidobacteria bacterium]|nr:hypothetical protein [Acidobacteriota bacterium]
MGAIALQGVRLSKAALGETVLVIGLGLIGQITFSTQVQAVNDLSQFNRRYGGENSVTNYSSKS